MSDTSQATPRPVSSVAAVALLALLCVFWFLAQHLRHHEPLPQNLHPDNLSKDLAWKATPESRRAALDKLRMSQSAQATSYGWVDKQAGIVQLPIERAMEVVVQEHGGSK